MPFIYNPLSKKFDYYTENATSVDVSDTSFDIYDDGDSTKGLAFQLASITSGNIRTLTIPDKDGTVALLSDITTVNIPSEFNDPSLPLDPVNNETLIRSIMPYAPVISQTNTPAVSPSKGDRYIVGTVPTGVWSDHENYITESVQTGVDPTNWTTRTPSINQDWIGVAYGNGVYVGLAVHVGDSLMYSYDGITWASTTAAAANTWQAVTYGNGLFVAVSNSGTNNRVMTSPDGINWTSQTSAGNYTWSDVVWGNGTFVVIAAGNDGDHVMTSPDGINWSLQTSASDNKWLSVTYGNSLFVAVSTTGTNPKIMTSPDGVTWTGVASPVDSSWSRVKYGNGIFVAIASAAAVGESQVIVSSDGVTWTEGTAANTNGWFALAYGNGLFVAVAYNGTGDGVMVSEDGLNWTAYAPATDLPWYTMTYGNGQFVALAFDSSANAVMTSDMLLDWQYIVPVEGDKVYNQDTNSEFNYISSTWTAIPNKETNPIDVNNLGTQLLVDARMQAATAAAWTAFGSTLSKETVGSDLVLRITYDSSNPATFQSIATLSGEDYLIIGKARGDGTAYPDIRKPNLGDVIWEGTTSTEWQYFSEIYTNDLDGYSPIISGHTSVASHVEYAYIYIFKVKDIKNSNKNLILNWVKNGWTYSEDITNAAWTKTNVTAQTAGILSNIIDRDTGLAVEYMSIAPDATDDEIHSFSRAFSVTVGQKYTLVQTLTAMSHGFAYVEIGSFSCYVNLSTGVVTSIVDADAVSTIVDGIHIQVKMDFTAVATASITALTAVAVADSDNDYAGTIGLPGIGVTGLQIIENSTISNNYLYWKTTTAAESGKHIILYNQETLTEYRNRLGLFERVDSDGFLTGIWESPVVGTEYLAGTFKGQNQYMQPFKLDPGGTVTLAAITNATEVAATATEGVIEVSGKNYSIIYGTSSQQIQIYGEGTDLKYFSAAAVTGIDILQYYIKDYVPVP